MEELSAQQCAAVIGVTVRRFNQIVADDDSLVRVGTGKYAAADFGKWMHRRTLEGAGVQKNGEILDYEAERARLTKAQADKTELEVSTLRSDLIPRELVIATWQALVAAARAKLLSMPTKMAHVVVAATELTEIEAEIKSQVYEALNELDTDGLPESIRDQLARSERSLESTAKPDNKRMGGQIPKAKPGKRGRTRPVAH